jgi:hypothetical protein
MKYPAAAGFFNGRMMILVTGGGGLKSDAPIIIAARFNSDHSFRLLILGL